MGSQPLERSQPDDQGGPVLHKTKVLASNTGRCVEDSFEGIGLNLGCGKIRWPRPWLNVDIDQGDLYSDIRSLALPDQSADRIAAIHVIEHFYQWEVPDILLEWKRVLKPGGKLILELPCLDKVFTYIAQCIQAGRPLSPTMSLYVFWGDPRYKNELMNHRYGYTTDMIKTALLEAGLESIELCEPRYHFPFRDMRIEAIKPC